MREVGGQTTSVPGPGRRALEVTHGVRDGADHRAVDRGADRTSGARRGQDHAPTGWCRHGRPLPGATRASAATAAGQRHPSPRAGQALMAEDAARSEEHTSELQSLMRISYAVFCLKKKKETH